jgi:serine/threonine protein kinase
VDGFVTKELCQPLTFCLNIEESNIIPMLQIEVDPDRLRVLMPYQVGYRTLYAVTQNRKLTEPQIMELTHQIYHGLSRLHQQSICHGNIKLTTIHVNKSLTKVKFSDYGNTRQLLMGYIRQNENYSTNLEPAFDCWIDHKNITESLDSDLTQRIVCDFYQVGCALFQMITKKTFNYQSEHFLDIVSSVQRQQPLDVPMWQGYSPQLLEFLYLSLALPLNASKLKNFLTHQFLMNKNNEGSINSSYSNIMRCLETKKFQNFSEQVKSNRLDLQLMSGASPPKNRTFTLL